MRVSSRTDYGVRALYDLALHYGQGTVQSREIAQRQQMPEAYLHQVLSALNRGGLIRSVRGPSGGHELARDPSEITLYDAFQVLDSAEINKNHPHQTPMGMDPVHQVWHELNDISVAFLRSLTFEDLVVRSRQGTAVPNYSI
ncbi:MAG: Rrf2 family transcriptional regulator [Thermomicrobiales bacterium]|nr:MAG: Rrf2 family transcriptional regulator [Thermomicrobiales bacterium]